MYLYLVRHGQSAGNVLRSFHGQTDYPLTELGHQQAREAGEKLKHIPFTRCCASDLRRAWDTALHCLEGRDVKPEVCLGLREHFVGDLEDTPCEVMDLTYPELHHNYYHDWYRTVPPGGETPEEMLQRVGRAVDEIVAQGEDTLVVGHNGSLTMLLVHLGLETMENAVKEGHVFLQGCFSAVEITADGAKLLWFNR